MYISPKIAIAANTNTRISFAIALTFFLPVNSSSVIISSTVTDKIGSFKVIAIVKSWLFSMHDWDQLGYQLRLS